MNDVLSSWLGLSPDVSIRWGLTLLHFLWQGMLIGLLTFSAARLLRNQSAVIRYWLHAAALLACPVTVAVTFAVVQIPPALEESSALEWSAVPEPAIPVAGLTLEFPDTQFPDTQYPDLNPHAAIDPSDVEVADPQARNTVASDESLNVPTGVSSSERIPSWLSATAKAMTLAYAVGVVGFLIRLASALWGGHRLRAISRPVSDSTLLKLIRDQAQCVGLRLVPVVAWCERIAVPTVIGVLRPMILLPATLTTGLTTDELSAILSHELAHIRRYDLWMNLLQRVIESLLFFHPVVWFLSRRLSAEREICCDDLVVRCGHEPLHYAGALLRMAELCAMPKQWNALTLAASGPSESLLEHRIIRLINLRPTPRLQMSRIGICFVMVAIVSAWAIPALNLFSSAGVPNDERVQPQPAVALQPVQIRDEQNTHPATPQAAAAATEEATSEETKRRIEPISITGTVLDSKGNPISGARVFAVSSEHGAYRKLSETVSNENGKYELIELQLPIVSAEEDNFLKKAHGAFEVFAMSEELGFTWRSSRPFYPDSKPFKSFLVFSDRVATTEGDLIVPDSPGEFFRGDKIEMDLVFNDPSKMRLRVVDDEGQPLGNVPVRLWNADPVPGAVREIFWSHIDVDRMRFSTLYIRQLMPETIVLRKTDAEGWFEFAAMPSDCEFRIQISPARFAERMIHATTGENYESKHSVLYTSGQDVIFPRTSEVAVTVKFGDSGKPAPNVHVSGGVWHGAGSQYGSTNEAGQIVLNLPPGDCTFSVLPEYKTPYVFVDDDSLRMNVEKGKRNTFEIVLQRAAELEVHVVDAETRQPVAGADLWALQPDGLTKRTHSWRSFEQPNVVHQGPRYSDDDGVIRTFIAPGQHSLGLCDYQTPEGYEPTAVADAVAVECKAGEKQTVTLKLKQAKQEARFQQAEGVPNAEVPVPILYPYCIVNTENLLPRTLAEAVAAFNRTAQESPTGARQPPITEQETRDAIAKFAAEKHVPEAVRVQLEEVLRSGTLPSKAYFRRFTRFDDGKRMRGVWWVRLLVETKDGPVYSVPVRSTPLFARPYTQMERQQNAANGTTLINRFVSYFEEPPNILLLREFPKDAVDRFIGQTKAAIESKDLKAFQSLFEWKKTSDTTHEFVASEFRMLTESQIHSIKVTPPSLRGHLLHWSAWQLYQPNLEIVGYLDIEYSKTDDDRDDRKKLTLEMGKSGDDFRLVNYIPQGERNPPNGTIEGLSISGHLEPLADGTHLITDVITNPGALLSAHLANEEIRQRDFRQPEQTAAADEGSPDIELPESDPAVSVNTDQQTPPQKTEPPATITEAQRRDIIVKAVEDADRIPDDQARQQAQWNLVSSLVHAGLRDEAFQQALKLRTANPQTCIYSLKTIAEDAIKRGDQATVQKAWDAANQSNKDSGAKYNHYVIELGFKLNRPVAEMLAVAAAVKRDDQQQAYRDIRNELAWRGRVDEAYAISAAHLPNLSKDFNDREIAYYCSSARSYDYYLKHDHLGQAIRIIEQMPKGEHRDAAIEQLIDGLLYVANKDQVTERNLALAETWAARIDDKLKQAAARAQILQKRLPGMSVEQLEQQLSSVTSREEKLEYLRRIFQKLLEENRIEEADRILPREVQLVKEQPRPEQKSKFGNVDDKLVERMTAWTHNAAIVRALHKAGRTEEAKARLEALKDLPDSEPVFLVGSLAGIRLQLSMELEDFDAVERYYADHPNPISSIFMAAWMMQKGHFDRGWTHVAPLMDMSPETMFPPELRSKPMYFLAQPFENLAKELFKVNRPDDALAFISKLPESRDTAHAFETFGELLVQSGRGAEFDQWLTKLPHDTARTHARLGALREIEKPSVPPAQP